jgi:hypothetical protein
MLDLFLAQAPGQPQAPPLQPLPHPDLPELPPVPAEIATWVWIVGGVITLIMLVLVLWLLLKPRPLRPQLKANPRTGTLQALRQLHSSVSTLPPPEIGHRVSIILRQYLEDRYHIPAPARTTPELFAKASDLPPTPRVASTGLLEVHTVKSLAPVKVVAPFAPLAELWDRMAFAPLPATEKEALQLVTAAIQRIEEDPA